MKRVLIFNLEQIETRVWTSNEIYPVTMLPRGFRLKRHNSVTNEAYSVTRTLDLRRASRFLVRIIFSSASAAFSWTPWTTSSGAFSTNCREQDRNCKRHTTIIMTGKTPWQLSWCDINWFIPHIPPSYSIATFSIVHIEDGW